MAKKILEDHKRKGKILQPPVLTIGTFVETAWVDYAIPEFIWILLLIKKYGVIDGSKLFLDFVQIVDPYLMTKVNNQGSAPSMLSFYSLLDAVDRKDIAIEVKKRILFPKLQNMFYPFINLYPECPLSFLFKDEAKKEISSEEYLKWYKIALDKFYEKTGYESSIVLANVVNHLLTFNRFFIVKDNRVPDLEEILSYPKTEESKRLASFLRATSGTFFNIESYDRSNYWVKYFWNQSIKIEPCKI